MTDKKNKKKILPFVIIALIMGAGIFAAHTMGLWPFTKEKPKYQWQNGMCYVSWTKDKYSSNPSDESLKELARLGTKWVAIVTTWYQDKCDTPDIHPADKTPTDESIVHAIKTAHSLGMKVMLKPHVDILDTSDGSWRGDIGCSVDPDWNKWFKSYRNFMVHYAKLAQDNNVELLCIGTELTSVSTIKEAMWKTIVIPPIKMAYTGPLTYAANWDSEFTHVKFWDMMDYVGIDAYFPLSKKKTPTIEEIRKGWEPWVKEIEEFQKAVNKPIIFPEVGYCSAGWTAKTPWEEIPGGDINLQLQADCYQVLMETFRDKPYFFGMYWWKWGTDVRLGGPGNRSFSPQNKPAQEVVETWYSKPDPKYQFDKLNVKPR